MAEQCRRCGTATLSLPDPVGEWRTYEAQQPTARRAEPVEQHTPQRCRAFRAANGEAVRRG